jgi:hypothetical protein
VHCVDLSPNALSGSNISSPDCRFCSYTRQRCPENSVLNLSNVLRSQRWWLDVAANVVKQRDKNNSTNLSS